MSCQLLWMSSSDCAHVARMAAQPLVLQGLLQLASCLQKGGMVQPTVQSLTCRLHASWLATHKLDPCTLCARLQIGRRVECTCCLLVSACRSEAALSRGRSQARPEDSACTFAPSINARSEKMLQVGWVGWSPARRHNNSLTQPLLLHPHTSCRVAPVHGGSEPCQSLQAASSQIHTLTHVC